MSVEITRGDRPCRFYWWIGSPVCDECGLPSEQHEGMAVPKPGSSPFGGGMEYLGLTWVEWREHCDHERRLREARQKIASASDATVLAVAAALPDHEDQSSGGTTCT